MRRPALSPVRAAVLAAFGLVLAVGGDPPEAVRSATNVEKSRVSFERGAESFWTGSGAAPAGWQSFEDGSRAAGNQAVLTNLDTQDADHLATLDTLTLRSPADFAYRAEVRSNGTAWLGIAFHIQDSSNYYVLRVQTGGTTWQLLKYANGSPSTLGSGPLDYTGGGCFPTAASVTVPAGAYVDLEVRRDPSQPTTIDVYYEGYKQASVVDSSPYSGGKVGLYYRQSPPLFCNPEAEGDIQVDIRIEVDPGTVVRDLDPRMYGTSLSMFGFQNGIGEIFTTEGDYQSAIDKWFGYIPTILGDLGPSAIRYPGGLQGNDYYWSSGIGPAIGRYSYDYSGFDSNVAVGVDEALGLAEELGAAVNLIVNIDSMVAAWGESTATQYAADWVEYCNAADDGSNPNGGTDWAAVRTANGHKEPYGVGAWELGNEISYFPSRPSVYANRVKAFSQAMKAVDPTIEIGAMDDAFCYWYGSNPLDWYTNGQSDGVLDIASAYFDFWASHPYGPSNYWSMVYRADACASVTQSFPSTGTYSFTFQAAQQSPVDPNGPHLRLDVDGIPAWSAEVTNGTVQGYSNYTAPSVPISAGTHEVSACATNAAVSALYVDTLVAVTPPGGGSMEVDFQDSKEFYEALVGTPEAIHTYFGQREGMKGGKPTYLTEWNSVFGTHNAAFDLKSMLSNAGFFESFLWYDMPYANFYPLYGEKETQGTSAGQFTGQVEGVAFDDQNGEMGRLDPRPRPSAFLIGLLREYFHGSLVQTRVAPHGFLYGPATGFTAGGIAGSYTEVPSYVSAYSALSESGNMLVVAAVNKDMENDHTATFDLGTYAPYSTATMITLAGSSIGITNEPEEGDMNVTPQVQGNPAATSFTYTLPKHSFTLILLPKQGSDPFVPGTPTGFAAALNGSNVDLSWNAVSDPDLAGYNVYRSRLASGPFRNRLNASPVSTTNYSDPVVERGVTFTYAVKAVDTDGNEGVLSSADSVTVPGGGPATTSASTVTVTVGSAGSPSSNLALADLATYNVWHSGGVADWYATFTIPQTPANVRALAVFFQGKQNAGSIGSPMTGEMYLWNYTTSAWDSATSTTFVANKYRSLHYGTTQAADLAKYISGTGEVKVRVRSSGAASFITYGDFLAVRSSD